MNELISVIIPVYNREAMLEECVRSLQRQSYGHLEILLIDDGSTDGTPALCRRLAEEDSRIRLLRGAHEGVSAARNLGLEAAAGAYLFFLDSDDVIHPLLLETLLTAMGETGAPLAGSGVCNLSPRRWEDRQALIAQDPGPGRTVFYEHDAVLEALFRSECPLSCIGGVMIRRELVGATRFSDRLFIGEDYWFLYENLIKGASALFLEQKWYYVRLHEGNSSRNWSYSGFYTRLLRRELVWKSELALGREEYANCQKREAFYIFLNCLGKHPPYSPDAIQMRRDMRERASDLLPALPAADRLRFHLYTRFPRARTAALKLKRLFKRAGA